MTLSSDQAARFIRNLQNAAKVPKTQGIAVVTQVTTNDQGMPVSAIATIGRETNVSVSLANGIGTITHPGETWLADLEGGATGRWRLVECINSRFLRIADQTDYELPTPQIPGVTSGGLYTESAQAGAGAPDASPDPVNADAVLYLYYWQTLPGSYSVHTQPVKQVLYQLRESQFEEWDRTQVADLYPNKKVELTLSGSVTAAGTALPVTVDSGNSGYLLEGQPAYWRVENEVILGVYSAGTIAVQSYTGPGSAVRGQGFTVGTGGRGQLGGTAAAHASGAVVELLSGQLAIPGLRPGVDYEVQVAFANQANRPGPWSSVQSFTSWSQDIAPSAPSDLTVEQLANVINATWTRVNTDLDANARGDIKRYVVARHTAALAATATFAAVAALATIIAGTAYPIANTSAQVPSTQGYGNYIGIAAVSDNGLLGEWSWADDDLAPPYPDPADVTFTSIPRGVLVNVPAGSDSRNAQTGGTISYTANLDPGFSEFWLWKADDSAGTAATVVMTFTAQSAPWSRSSGLTGWFKVTAADGAGNSNGPATYPSNTPKAGETNPNTANWSTGWKFCASLYAEESLPPNGNFQDPNDTNTDARDWGWVPTQVGTGTIPSITVAYDNNGGLEGNYAYKATITEGPTGSLGPTLRNQAYSPLPAHSTSVTGSLWIKSSTAMSVTLDVSLQFTNNSGTPLSPIVMSSGSLALAANTWTKISIAGGPTYPSAPTGTFMTVHYTVLPVAPASRSYTWYLDATELVFV